MSFLKQFLASLSIPICAGRRKGGIQKWRHTIRGFGANLWWLLWRHSTTIVVCLKVSFKPERSPNLALLDRVHFWSGSALKISCEIRRVGKRSDHPKSSRRMCSGLDPFLQCFRSIFWAPCVGCSNPEKLSLTEIQTWKNLLLAMTGFPPTWKMIENDVLHFYSSNRLSYEIQRGRGFLGE